MYDKSSYKWAKAQNAAQACEAYKQATGKVQKATVKEVKDEDTPRCHPHNESPLEDPEIVEIINEFVHIQEDGFIGYDPELEDYELEDDEDDPDPLIEIQKLTDLEVFTQTLQKAHDAATAAECKHQKGNKQPKRYLGNSKRTRHHHELNQKELEKKGFTSVIQWLSAAQKEKRDGSVSAECSSSQAEPDYVASDQESDDEVRDIIEDKKKGSTC
ncbi:hypothetical protein L208DRAFT_1377112 [Tricholoma matsutake]|nr:hypothetical protein L208DRAFT_1377112 [Tricholoma matsutake 945]